MVIVLYGTIGEYIKLFPLLQRLGSECLSINVNMQPEQMKELFASSDLPRPDISALNGYKGKDIDTTFRMFVWTCGLAYTLLRLRRRICKIAKEQPTMFMVHGDTIITPIGTFFGRFWYRLQTGHIEAGFRSGTWREPFPEELDRIITDHMAHVNYAVGEDTIKYLRPPHTKGRIVDTKYNTILDALRSARNAKVKQSKYKLPPRYILVSMHRSEIINRKDKMTELAEALAKSPTPVVWLDHAPTKEKMTQYKLDKVLSSKNIIRIPKQPYFQFISIVSKAVAIITDSGGLQEEAYLLGIPTLIHREINEKAHMGTKSDLEKKVLRDFLKNFVRYPAKAQNRTTSPTDVIIKDLAAHGYISKKKISRG